MGFGTVLKTLREKAGLSQAALADRVGLSVRNVQNWEQGHRTPRAQVLMLLAKAVGVSVEQLLAGIDQDETPAKAPPKGKGKPTRKPKK